ncbi:MAG: hypothetical protein RR060_06340, partial [Victivallaceae bacterium]
EVSTIVYSSDGGLTVTETLYNGATLITKKYRDGQIDSEYGTGRVPTYYNYGTDPEKGYFTYTANSAGGANYTRTFYDIFGRISRVEKPGMNSTMLSSERTYNALSQLIKSTTPGMASTLYEYNDLGELLRSGLDIDNNGTLDLASSDRIQESEHSFVKLDNSWYDENKSLVYGTAGSGTATLLSTQRNKLTNLAAGVASESVSIDRYGNETTSRVEFNRAGKQVKNITVYPNSPIAAESTTINGLQTSVRDQLNQITTYTYDGLERPLTITDSRGNTQSVSYHTTGVGQIGDVATITDAANNTTSFTTSFNGVNKIKATTNAQGKISYNAYNAMGLVYRIWGATDYPIQLTYDSFGRQTELRTFRAGTPAIWAGANFPTIFASQASVTSWTYDNGTNLVTKKTNADGKSVNYSYTDYGQLSRRQYPRLHLGIPVATEYSYDPMTAELTQIKYIRLVSPQINFTYDRLGNKASVTDAAGTRNFTYNDKFDLTKESINGIYNKEINYSYSNTGLKGRLEGFNVNNTASANYTYDEYGRMASINDVNYAYAANGGMLSSMRH